MGGEIDEKTRPYKQFTASMHERFLIQRGKLGSQEVVFKVAEHKDKGLVENESRNLRTIEHAPVKPGAAVDVHFVHQAGEKFGNEHMFGFATEYIQDDVELKRQMTPDQKIATISSVIDNLQKLTVTDAARESGLSVHDGRKIVKDAQYFLSELTREGLLGHEVVEQLRERFEQSSATLSQEELVFVHGDAHGDNIFVQQGDGKIDVALLDFEGLRISNKYHDWVELLNKAVFLQGLENNRPADFEQLKQKIKDMWLDSSVMLDEARIMDKLTGGDPQKKRTFSSDACIRHVVSNHDR